MRDPSKWLKMVKGQADLVRLRSSGRLASDLGRYELRSRAIDFFFSRNDPGFELLDSGARWVAARLRRRRLSTVHLIESADHTFSRKA
jgi:hypothetical protein